MEPVLVLPSTQFQGGENWLTQSHIGCWIEKMSTKKFLLLILCLHCNQQIVLSRVPHDNREENCDENTNRVYMVSENLKSNSIQYFWICVIN